MSPHLEFLLNFILNNYFNNSCVIFFGPHFNYKGEIPTVKLQIANDSFDENVIFNKYFGCQGIVIEHNNPVEIFRKFEHQIRLNNDRFNSRRYLILSENLSQPEKLFQLEELNFVSDLLLVTPREKYFDLMSHRYVGTSQNNDAFLVDRFFTNNSFLFGGRNLYPDKISNQQGRFLKMATFTYEPYSIVGDSIKNHHGSELTSAIEFGLRHNMTPVPVVNSLDYWGEIYPNWSGSGLLGNLINDKADVGFGALYTWEVCYYYLDLSKPLIRTGVTCLVPAPKLVAGWLTPVYSYSMQMWLCIMATSLLATLTAMLCLLYSGYSLQRAVSVAISLTYKPLLLQSLYKTEVPSRNTCKIMLASVLVMTFFLTTSYSSGFATIMTIPRYQHPINTVEEFADSGLEWGATQEAWVTSIRKSEDENHKKIVKKFNALSEEILREKSFTDQFAFSVERLPFADYAIGNYIKDDVINKFHLMQQDLYWEQCVMMVRKNSILLPYLDDFVLRIFEVGLISQWQQIAVDLYMNPNVQKALKYYRIHLMEHRVVKLKWTHVEGAFGILMIGHLFSLIVFMAEKCLYKTKCNRKK